MNKTDLQALVRPTVTRLVQDPLAVTRFENRLYILMLNPNPNLICPYLHMKLYNQFLK